MPTMQDVRAQYPQYNDMSDDALASALHRKFYSDMPHEEFRAKIGLGASQADQRAPDPIEQFNQLPWYGKLGQAADDIVRKAANGLTLGYADKLASYMDGSSIGDERAKTEAAGQRAGIAGSVAELAGTFLPASKAANAGLTLMKFAPKAGGAMGLAARSGLMAGDGAILGAIDASGHDKSILGGAAIGAAGGALGNVAGEAIGAGIGKLGGVFGKSPPVMGREELKAASQAAYKKADDAGVILHQDGLRTLSDDIRAMLTDEAFHPALQPRIGTVVSESERIAQQPATFKGAETFRRIARGAGDSLSAEERRLSAKTVGLIDDYLTNLKPSDVMTGDAKAASQALAEARDLWGRQAKLGAVEKAVDDAGLSAAASGTGANINNRTRQKILQMLTKQKNWTPDERAALKNVISGSTSGNLARKIGTLAPTGIVSGGIGTSLGAGIGSFVGGPAGAAVGSVTLPSIGALAKKYADRTTRKGIEELTHLIASGGNAAALKAPENALQTFAKSERETIARLMMLDLMSRGRNELLSHTVTP